MTDKLIICLHCNGDCCYETDHTFSNGFNIKSYMCMGCGFTTNTTLKEGSEELKQSEASLPELYKDLRFVDPNQYVWFPSVINIPEQGIVFANGASKDEWGWAGVKAIPVTEEEKLKYPIPHQEGKYYTHRTDMNSLKMFEKRGYMDACEYIGLFQKVVGESKES